MLLKRKKKKINPTFYFYKKFFGGESSGNRLKEYTASLPKESNQKAKALSKGNETEFFITMPCTKILYQYYLIFQLQVYSYVRQLLLYSCSDPKSFLVLRNPSPSLLKLALKHVPPPTTLHHLSYSSGQARALFSFLLPYCPSPHRHQSQSLRT